VKDALGSNFTVNDRVAVLGDPDGEVYVGRVGVVDLVDNRVTVECDLTIRLGRVVPERMTIQEEPRWILVLK
jgi:hypothetical protein